MDALQNLPLDLVRLILEVSASRRESSAVSLSLVFHQIQSWCAQVDPFLFRYIYCFKITQDTTPIPEWMCNSKASPRLIRARNYVEGIAWHPILGSTAALQVWLSTFPNLKQLCLWNDLFPIILSTRSHQFNFERVYPALRRLCICLGRGDPFWRHITQLHIQILLALSSDRSLLRWPVLGDMPSLTHLVLDGCRSENEPNIAAALTRVKASWPASLRLCILFVNIITDEETGEAVDERTGHILKWARSGRFDERLILWLRKLEPWGEFYFNQSNIRPVIFKNWSCPWNEVFYQGKQILEERRNEKIVK
ncbi:hypothetical protein DL96DRAFT_1638042 [Flagelloscypha sp. PMI_526]|nr:hypothetical protein DL96DRAFT_1638042 [Flagelloscypha sp. PMI_526]